MAIAKKNIYAFYSWQSDSPKETNLNAIRDAIKKAGKNIGAIYTDKKIILDDATRDTAGSPDIVKTLLEKISKADIFIADITTITDPEAKKASPNPNVMFELGYAAAQLGWDRIILLFNESIGNFDKDLPFDIGKHRTGRYNLTKPVDHNDKEGLDKLLQHAIKLIIDKDPKRPAELVGKSRAQIEHEYDVENLRGLMSTIHLPIIDKFISEMPHTLIDEAFFFWDYFKMIYTGSTFHIFDPTINREIDAFAQAWSKALSHPSYYDRLPNDNYIFVRRGRPFEKDVKVAWEEIENACDKMRNSLDLILTYLRNNFIEVDLKKADQDAWKFYVKINSA
ncbi:TIR domain-containing protein [Methylophilus sp. Leaf414]|uniref:TIR domain-containing protein n=1 Tax=Methylophilus sp. Leaf414 TaxID=1736371 RepID=UPI0006FC3BD1|nr:TIR domain-containing protein [Methylophilus sp. Leaf414]KQT34160.1 hypothetical protein ASG24_10450 [Methylophilus sp. Leaf414]